ncbi:hypothetical protein [Deinococcus sonorensis]|uniref:Uncharacterized protein n=2 Tax=Deinococcus sonorensis TaxID=309891 RepID=A0AAU7UG93_9DEIO
MKMALTTRQQKKEVNRLLAGERIMTLEQLTRLGLQRGVAAMDLTLELRTLPLNRSPKLLERTFVALKYETLYRQPTPKLKHLALLAEGARLVGVSPSDWREVTTHGSGATPDAVWIRGPSGAGLDWALEVDTTYGWDRVATKFGDFGPRGFRVPGRSGSAAPLGYRGVVWIVTNRHRQARVGRWLYRAGFSVAPPGRPLPLGVSAFRWSGSGQTLEVWVVCALL